MTARPAAISEEQGSRRKDGVAGSQSQSRPWYRFRSLIMLLCIVLFAVVQLVYSMHIVHSMLDVTEPTATSAIRTMASRATLATAATTSGSAPTSASTSAFTSSTNSSTTRKYAYAFLVAGCDPDKPWSYRNYIYNILVSKFILQTHSSNADVIVMLQISKYSNHTTLTARDETWLHRMGVKYIYLPKPVRDNFYAAQMEKFRILQLHHYSRVLYLDSDAMPLCNLDYLLEASIDGKLQPNVIFAWFNEPAHGGIFLLEPAVSHYPQIQEIIHRREEEALRLPYPHWDPVVGWGTPIPNDDPWRVIQSKDGSWTGLPGYPPSELYDGINWTFHGDFADQGLLYYWTKFHKQQVTIINLDDMEHWGSTADSHPDSHLGHDTGFGFGLGATISNATITTVVADNVDSGGGKHNGHKERKPKLLRKEAIDKSSWLWSQHKTCLPIGMEHPNHYGSTRHPMFLDHAPHRDFIHFSGDSKPWESPAPVPLPESIQDLDSSKAYWYWCLRQVTRQLNVTIRSFDKLPHSRRPALGRYPTFKSMKNTIESKRKQQQQQHQQQEK